MPIKRRLFASPDPAEIDDAEEARIQSGIANDPDAAELTDAELAQLRPAREVLPPALYAGLIGARKRGRPKAATTKEPVKLRLDPETLERFRASGAGWQTRMGRLLAQNEMILDLIEQNVELLDGMRSLLGYMRKGELRMVFEPIESSIEKVEENVRTVTAMTHSLRDRLVVE